MQIFCKKTYLKNTLLTLSVMVMASAVPVNSAAAQITPTCEYTDAAGDTDDDGYALENGANCRVKPEFVNQVSGLPVNLDRAIWLAEDVDRSIEYSLVCSRYSYIPDLGEYRSYGSALIWDFNPQVDDNCVADGRELCGGEGTILDYQFFRYTPYTIDNGRIEGFSGDQWLDADFETPDWVSDEDASSYRGYRRWTSSEDYLECSGISPSGTYVTPAPVCIDTDPVGDGWGWDGASSCRIAEATPVAGACIDSDPVGDGWGWDGVSSCQVSAPPTATPACVDTDPVGDGWGWNGTTSCRTAQADTPACYDWDGDGWGWDGAASCIP